MLPTKFRFIWPNGFRGDFFFNRPIRNKNCLWWPFLLTDRQEIREDLKKSINQKQEVWWPFAYGSGQNVHS
jgi:hypothetical protein